MSNPKQPDPAIAGPIFLSGGLTDEDVDERPKASSAITGSIFQDTSGTTWKAINTPVRSTWRRVWLFPERALRICRRLLYVTTSSTVILLLASVIGIWMFHDLATTGPKPNFPSLDTLSIWLRWLFGGTVLFGWHSLVIGLSLYLNAADPRRL